MNTLYNRKIRNLFCLSAGFITAAIILFMPTGAIGGTKFSLILTSNLQGRFTPVIESQDEKDPMLLLAQSITAERGRSPFDLYLDLGNSFYPGPVSKYSYGSVMMDFFTYFNCAATLVSSRDISIGLSNLEFLAKGRETKLLSINITRDNTPVFNPCMIINHGSRKIGFIGITSSESLFDIADKKMFKIYFNENVAIIKETAAKLKEEGCTDIILLSGLTYRKNLGLMQEITEADLLISGGDSSGKLFNVPLTRAELQGGRSIVNLSESEGYYRVELDLAERISVTSIDFRKSEYNRISDKGYNEFRKRLTIWKQKFADEANRVIAEGFPPAAITDESAAEILRHRHRTEVAIIDKYTVFPQALYGTVYSSTISGIVNNDYPLFKYRLTGSELKKVSAEGEDFVITGIHEGKVQNYPIADSRRYTVCSTQSAYDRVCRLLRKNIPYDNTWKTIEEEFEDDISSERIIASDSFDYLERRFRVLIDISLSNFYDKSDVLRDETIETPPGKPSENYTRWGMEDTLNITIYNRYHHLVLTPYIYFIKQDDQYLQNLLRGTLLYTYNLNAFLKPYHKSQIDTVLVADKENEEGPRPMLARETVGASFFSERISGKIGSGFEKQIQDPEEPALYGIEAIIDASLPITDYLKYIFKLDSFISSEKGDSQTLKARTEITNTLSLSINSILGVSVKHKWFKLYSKEIEESYRYSQMLLSVDLKTDFKLF
ncbi:MAG TPA: hypothetical protein PLT13_08320 [Spirochaetota bacterium]|nr:hypothetical protein [Spirochaetota bacterium]